MEENMNIEQTWNLINEIPSWIKNEEDMKNYIVHLQFKLSQSLAEKAYYQSKYKINEAEWLEIQKIKELHDEIYNEKNLDGMAYQRLVALAYSQESKNNE